MTSTMLIDAAHPEETRVVVCDQNRVDEFDFESATKKQLRGNIYLARVTRVEPSLQAAFVEFGGNRHGFLAFDEIHPDYYQIPHEDRVALMEEERQAVAAATRAAAAADEAEGDAPDGAEADGEGAEAAEAEDDDGDSEDAVDAALAQRRQRLLRKYKIQEVIKRRQILLVQVVKEERGNKGAALTTYMSLAGRYCVLMPNTARGGGISRKITSAADRKRLKKAVGELETPDGMGLIVRTAGAKRTKAEIKRDYDYLLRLWETIRTQTLKSIAPCLIYEESNLVKRAIRDLYDKDIEAVLVAGEGAYREAKDFIRMLMPSHAKKVQLYREPAPIFTKYRVEDQLEQIYNQTVQLKSGGYIVINQTEALVSIDVNSGRATKERNVEATATKTNLEAAEEVARQMRLRDLAGLVVIDFIDMEDQKNVRNVEKRMRDCLQRDRARLQVGKISQFGLMELSRQRRRASVLEGSHTVCPTCDGRGVVRSVESSALFVIRALEDEAFRGKSKVVRLRLPTAVALYLLNEKRGVLTHIEQLYELRILVEADSVLIPPAHEIVRVELRSAEELEDFSQRIAKYAPVVEPEAADLIAYDDEDEEVIEADGEPRAERAPRQSAEGEAEAEGEGAGRRRRRRRRGGRGSSSEAGAAQPRETGGDDDQEFDAEADGAEAGDDAAPDGARTDAADPDGEGARRRRRRGRRGGRNRSGRSDAAPAPAGMEIVEVDGDEDAAATWEDDAIAHDPGQPRPGHTRPTRAFDAVSGADEPDAPVAPVVDEVAATPAGEVEPAAQAAPEPVAPPPSEPAVAETLAAEPVAAEAVVAETAPEAEPEAPAPVKRPRRSRAKAAAPVEPAPAEPTVEPAVEPAVEAAPDVTAEPAAEPVAEAVAAATPAVIEPEPVAAPVEAPEAAPSPAVVAVEPPAPPAPMDTERRQRWQDRLKSWMAG